MINSDVNRIFGLLDRLTGWLPGQPKAPEAPVLHMAYGVGLGGLLGRLFEEHFMETCGSSVRERERERYDLSKIAFRHTELISCKCFLFKDTALSEMSYTANNGNWFSRSFYMNDILDH